MKGKLSYILLYLLAVAFCTVAFAQEQPPVQGAIITDTVETQILIPLRQRVENEIKKSIAQLKADHIAVRQNKVFDNILKFSEVNDYLETGIDTAGIASQLDHVLRFFHLDGDGIFTNKTTTQTERNLATSSTLLSELLSQAEILKRTLQSYLKNLIGYQNNIDPLASDSILVEFHSDSLSFKRLIV